jgi:hypothetical protein
MSIRAAASGITSANIGCSPTPTSISIEGGSFREIDTGQDGDLVCYFSGPEWRHVGVTAGSERVMSKWGTYPLYEHGLAEVSEEYGDRVRFYRRPSSSEALANGNPNIYYLIQTHCVLPASIGREPCPSTCMSTSKRHDDIQPR